jgi:hypothetical protein
MLSPQDIVVLLKLSLVGDERPPYSEGHSKRKVVTAPGT